MVSLLIIGTIVLVVAAMLSDPALAAFVGRTIGTAWSDSVAFFVRLVSRAG